MNAYTPVSNPECQVDVKTTLSTKQTKLNENVRLTTTLTNTTKKGLPMSIAMVGIPSGLSLQAWQLKEIQEKGIVDFYEVRKNYVVFYYRELGPGAVQTINLDLKAEVPGTYLAPASTAYVYYTGEYKKWAGGEKIRILE